jgi:hypothetical protein
MKKVALALQLLILMLLILISAASALACGDAIYTLQTDPGRVGSLGVPCDVIVTATRPNGFFCQQVADPGVNPGGEYSGIWVYTGSDLGYVPGDILAICGLVKEYFDLTEIDVPAAGLYGSVLKTGSGPTLPPYYVTAAQLAADSEPWESVQITITDGMEVPVGFDLGHGEWNVVALDGTPLIFDDYWYNFLNVMEGQCYNNATGIYTFGFGTFRLEPYVDGIPIVNCAVGVETVSLGAIKAMFR